MTYILIGCHVYLSHLSLLRIVCVSHACRTKKSITRDSGLSVQAVSNSLLARDMYAVYFGLVAVLSSFGLRFVGRYCSIINKMPGACMN